MERDYLAEAFAIVDDPRDSDTYNPYSFWIPDGMIKALVGRIREQDAEVEKLRKDLREHCEITDTLREQHSSKMETVRNINDLLRARVDGLLRKLEEAGVEAL